MPLGDSLTSGHSAEVGYLGGGYRDPLYMHLNGVGCNFVFVGNRTSGYTATLTDAGQTHHEGHGGYTINQLSDNLFGNDGSTDNYGGYWLSGISGVRAPIYPDIILLDIGTNDIFETQDAILLRNRLDDLLSTIYSYRPDVAVLVANMVPRIGYESASQAYNALIPDLVAGYDSQGLQCYFVDMHSALTTADLSDIVHPSTAGYQKMANTWFAALQANDLITVPEPSVSLMIITFCGIFLLAGKRNPLVTSKIRSYYN